MRAAESPEPILTVRGEFGDGLAELVARKLTPVARHAHAPVLAFSVELYRHSDPAVPRPVATRMNLDFNGRRRRNPCPAAPA